MRRSASPIARAVLRFLDAQACEPLLFAEKGADTLLAAPGFFVPRIVEENPGEPQGGFAPTPAGEKRQPFSHQTVDVAIHAGLQ